MDAPNAPNPANPNAQGQNADAEQGPTVQNQAPGPADQNQEQVPVGQFPGQDPAQVVQNVPVQQLQQPVLMQPAPAGVVMPAPQLFLFKLDREVTRIFR